MIARVWHGVVPKEKADGYAAYLADSDRGVRDYQRIPGNRGVYLFRQAEGDRVRFLLISLWDSREAIAAYAGPDIEKAQYFPYDRECLIDPEPNVAHYDVLVASGPEGEGAGRPGHAATGEAATGEAATGEAATGETDGDRTATR